MNAGPLRLADTADPLRLAERAGRQAFEEDVERPVDAAFHACGGDDDTLPAIREAFERGYNLALADYERGMTARGRTEFAYARRRRARRG